MTQPRRGLAARVAVPVMQRQLPHHRHGQQRAEGLQHGAHRASQPALKR